MPDQDHGPLNAALAKAQAAFPAISRDKEVTVKTKSGDSYKFKYAPLDKILSDTRQPLATNGLAITQLIDSDPDGLPYLITRLLHESGVSIEGRTPIPHANGETVQAFGSAITYLRRYAIQALLGIAAEEDDDGNAASGNRASFGEPRRPRGAAPTGIEPIPAAAPPAAPPQRTEPTEELLGVLSKAGTVKKGGADGFQLEARQQPDGMALGFRLEVDGDRAIPQVLIEGQLGADVVDALGGKPESLEGKWARVRGRLFQVSQPGRTSYYRLRVQAIETKDWALPAEPEAPSAALFPPDVEAELDAAVPA